MTTVVQISSKFSPLTILHADETYKKPINYGFLPTASRSHLAAQRQRILRCTCFQLAWGQKGTLVKDEGLKRKKRFVLVRFNQGFGFNGGGSGGGGGGGKDDGTTARVLGNLALAIGLTYLSMTGQLGWILDAIVSIWLVAVLIPIIGVGAFIWWAQREIVQGTCPNCGNDFQVLKSSLKDELQLCPFCTQPFSVEDDKFVRDSVTFSNQPMTFGQAFNDFYSSNKGEDSSKGVVDVEAEVKDVE